MINRKMLINGINKISSLESIMKNSYISEEIKNIKSRIEDDTFRIAVVGEFSSGKSTFINAIIGKDILTHAVNETTAAITYIYNVPENDEKIGSCDVIYNNGKSEHLADMNQLKNYTTVQSNNNVVEKIKSVSVYVHFLDTNLPVVIMDTPGLNGIAEKHREITINEVKKAHACIYVFSLKGITDSDKDFINILLNYQNQFIFVQNFIDCIRKSEGETAENKIREIDNSLKSQYDSYKFEYNIIAVSALKALVSKDREIRKLYSDDIYEISEAQRKEIYSQSNFRELEEILEKIMKEGKYRQIVLESAVHRLKNIIDEILNNLNTIQEINTELRKNDSGSERIEHAEAIKKNIEDKIPGRKRSLENLIIARDAENRRILKSDCQKMLEEISSEAEKDIDSKITKYDDIQNFEDRYKSSVPVYYNNFLSRKINSELLPELNRNISGNMGHLYDEVIQRVTRYTMELSEKKSEFDVKELEDRQEKFEIKDKSWQMEIERNRQKVSDEREKSRRLDEAIRRNNSDLRAEEAKLSEEKQNRERVSKEYDNEVRRLGSRPEVEYRKEARTRTVKRTGFLGRIMDFFSTKTETYFEYVPDDSRQREWEREKASVSNRYSQLIQRHKSKMNGYEDNIRRLNYEINNDSRRKAECENNIRDIESRIKNETEYFEKALKVNQNEFCINQKKQLKREIRDILLGRTGNECVIERMENYIDRISDRNLPEIKDMTFRFFDENVRSQIESLNKIIASNNEKLDRLYESNESEINILKEIKNSLRSEKI